jgi:hypothetical protein
VTAPRLLKSKWRAAAANDSGCMVHLASHPQRFHLISDLQTVVKAVAVASELGLSAISAGVQPCTCFI